MARFYATIQGNRGEASRMGTPNGGIGSHTRGWNIGASVTMQARDSNDVCKVRLTNGSNDRGFAPPVSIEAIREPERVQATVQIGDVTVTWNSEERGNAHRT